MSIKIGIAPDSWGVWFPASDPNNEKQPQWWRCLDEMKIAGYDGCEIGPWGYMPNDNPQVLKNAIDYLPPATLKDKAVGLVGYSWYGAVKPLEHLREILSTFDADVRDEQVGINLGSDFQDGVFQPSDELSAQIRELLASLA